jgi:NAD(P)H dehydrogenase (quinone)
MSIAIIGATGGLGGHAIDALMARGATAEDILVFGRNQDRLAELGRRGLLGRAPAGRPRREGGAVPLAQPLP